MFSRCSIFVFTLGLTECWRRKDDKFVFPVAPGVVTDEIDPGKYEFHNFGFYEIRSGLTNFLLKLKGVNPRCRVILTVSPVPLIATYTQEHVMTATTYSKSVLRAVCEEIKNEFENVYYFPSYEIVTGNYSRGLYYNKNLRTVTKEGVAHVMKVFGQSYLEGSTSFQREQRSDDIPICDEEEIVRSIGF